MTGPADCGSSADSRNDAATGSRIVDDDDAQAAQRGYQLSQNFYDPHHRNLVTDAHTPGAQGTTWTGLSHVPPGETFSRNPTTGPQLPNVPGNN